MPAKDRALAHVQSDSAAAPAHPGRSSMALLTLGAVGIVFGGIGTSPLYAVDQIFLGREHLALTATNVIGGISLVIWTLTIIVAINYAALVLRADNDGEGGIFALYGLLHERAKKSGTRLMLLILILGAGLLFGDGMITPAISVLSALEGLRVVTPALGPFIVPATLVLLTVLFSLQHHGVSGIGRVFGPVLIVWFFAMAFLGTAQILRQPGILQALDPRNGFYFLGQVGVYQALVVLGALVLCVAGGEALYADLGHFGKLPIRIGWYALVYPALVLNYLGQGAYLLSGRPVLAGKIFFSLVPGAWLGAIVVLATAASVIASQALISGAFSLASQAVRLGLFPRMKILHTHTEHAGQIYISVINWATYAGCILLVFEFGSSAALSGAYGVAVSGVMVITSIAMFSVARLYWAWQTINAGVVWGILTMLNASLFLASSLKFLEGGFVPVSIGLAVAAVMVTWQWGRKATFAGYSAKSTMSMAELVRLHRQSDVFLERNAILMVPKPLRRETDRTPALLQLLWDRYGILSRNLIFVEIIHQEVPHIRHNRYAVTIFDQDLGRRSIISVEVSFGFMEEPNIEQALEEMAQLKEINLPTDRCQWIVHVSMENLLPSKTMSRLKRIRFRLFLLLRRISRPVYYYYGLGDEVQLSTEILPVRVR